MSLLLQLREYEQVIIEDRIEKERNKKKLEQELFELKSIIKVKSHSLASWGPFTSTAGLTQ